MDQQAHNELVYAIQNNIPPSIIFYNYFNRNRFKFGAFKGWLREAKEFWHLLNTPEGKKYIQDPKNISDLFQYFEDVATAPCPQCQSREVIPYSQEQVRCAKCGVIYSQ